MDGLHFYILFNTISVISGQWEGDNEQLCAMESVKDVKDGNIGQAHKMVQHS